MLRKFFKYILMFTSLKKIGNLLKKENIKSCLFDLKQALKAASFVNFKK